MLFFAPFDVRRDFGVSAQSNAQPNAQPNGVRLFSEQQRYNQGGFLAPADATPLSIGDVRHHQIGDNQGDLLAEMGKALAKEAQKMRGGIGAQGIGCQSITDYCSASQGTAIQGMASTSK